MTDKKRISVVTSCYNEEGNVEELCRRVRQVFEKLGTYDYEHILVDNASKDQTVSRLREIAKNDPRVKVIVNARNFGAIRSGYYGLIQAHGDAVIGLVADLQDPPELLPEFIRKWEEGYKVVKGIKVASKENFLMRGVRSFYYALVGRLSDVKLDSHFSGFALYDRQVIDQLRVMDDPYPYLRGLIAELGFESTSIPYTHGRRKSGKSSYNFYELYDTAMLGITSHSRIPLRLATLAGFAMSLLSLAVAIGYLAAKLIFWPVFPFGLAPALIGMYLLASVQLFFIGMLGEYIGLMHMRILKRPLVIEKERINFK